MKTTAVLAAIAAVAVATSLLGFAFGTFAVATYTLGVATCFALIIGNDYAPRSFGYAAGRPTSARRERLPFAA